MTARFVKTGCWAGALVMLGLLAGCSSSAKGQATSTASSSTAPTTPTTAPAEGTRLRWKLDTKPGFLNKQCNASEQCVLLATENGTLSGDLTGTLFTGSSAAFSEDGHFYAARTDLFRGTVKGCGAGTLVLVGAELADLKGGTGDWQVAEGFGTGDLVDVTGHGTGSGTVGKDGFHSQWEGVIDCGT